MESSILKRLIIIGASGHGKVIADIALKNGYQQIAFLDDDEKRKECAGFPVIGNISDIPKYKEWDFIVAIGNSYIREKIFNKLSEYNISTLIHPNAVISRRVTIGKGTVIMAGAVVNSDVSIGQGCIVNTCASVDHDCIIGDFSHISVGSHVAGTVAVGRNVWIGAGAVVSNNIDICNDCIVGAGAVVIQSLNLSGTYVGVPARILKGADS